MIRINFLLADRNTDVRAIPFAPNYLISADGRVYSEKYGHRLELSPWRAKYGYLAVTLRAWGVGCKVQVQRIVAIVFHGSPPTPRHEARHLDGNPANNAKHNIAWGTHAENMADMVAHGRQGPLNHPEKMRRGANHPLRLRPDLAARGEAAGGAKMTAATVTEIRRRAAAGERQSSLAREFGITQTALMYIVKRRTWKHVV